MYAADSQIIYMLKAASEFSILMKRLNEQKQDVDINNIIVKVL